MHHWNPRFDFQHPPGTYEQWLAHPTRDNTQSPVGLTHEHRFAFYFWARWLQKKGSEYQINPPDLVTIDWHRDLAPPNDQEKADLENLDLTDSNELSLFCWGYLNPHNDGHILSAAYKNIIGDIYLLCKQEFNNRDYILDLEGNTHKINVFKTREQLEEVLPQNNDLFFDLDLDYFTETDSFMGMDADLELTSEKQIRSLIDPGTSLINDIFEKLAGMTIALEPEFCGGYRNSSYIFDVVDDQLFHPHLLHPESVWNIGNNS